VSLAPNYLFYTEEIGKMDPYVYQLLSDKQGILLTVYCSQDNPLCCSLQNVSPENLASYIAISYTWGEPTLNHPMECDGKEIKVTANLHAALQTLQRNNENVDWTVWADAICIDRSRACTTSAIDEIDIHKQLRPWAFLGKTSKVEYDG
jgi:hypothetical protein